jgi:cellulose synthase/poly-beta-1,6-N-acetylglucosamine synthase-like glycosyltransferase
VNTAAWILVAIPLVLAGYAYLLYPAILWIIARRAPQEIARRTTYSPTISVVLPAYNEEHQIAGAIDAVLAQTYPANLVQVLVISDASSDATDKIVAGYGGRGVELLRMTERSGKTKAENIAAKNLRGEIVVNTDASVRLHPDAVRNLTARMADPTVGVVSSRDVSISKLGESANATEAGYVGYEMWVRDLETRTGGIVGASGSCYAIRSDLHKIPIRDDLSRDFSSALTARLHGLRAVSANDALCFVPRTASLEREYRRKVRTISRGMDTLFNRRELLDPTRYGLFAWKLLSHKVCRWLVPVSIIPATIGLLILARSHDGAKALLLIGVAALACAAVGARWPRNAKIPRVIALIAFATAANVAVIHALWRVVGGEHDHVWEPTRREA